MQTFSQRIGIVPKQKPLQLNEIDDDLRNRIWNIVYVCVWSRFHTSDSHHDQNANRQTIRSLQRIIHHSFLKLPLDEIADLDPENYFSNIKDLKKWYFSSEWNRAYDFIQFIADHLPDEWSEVVQREINGLLVEENSGYRFINNILTPISDEHEIETIMESMETKFSAARRHITRAVELISEKQNPDYRNCVKESISAVESAVNEVTDSKNGSLGQALNVLGKAGDLHPALKEGMSKLYGYASDKGGVRHALSDESASVSYAEAKYMLVICSGFINFIATSSA